MLNGQWLVLDVAQNSPETAIASFYATREDAENAAINLIVSGAIPDNLRIVELANAEVFGGFVPETP